MIAKTLPVDALNIALSGSISFCSARANAASEEKGKIVAAKKAEKKRANSAIFVC